MIASAFISLLIPALVSAHGYVNQVVIDGTSYPGNSVGTTPTIKSVIRQVNTNSPVKGATNPDINCGASAQLAADVATANPGSSVQVYWVGGTTSTPTSHEDWPHNTGPIMHYMTKCPGSCAQYNSSNAEWFKISEQGQVPGGSTWYQAQIQAGAPANVTIPSNLAPGNYLLRSELIALQIAMSVGGAEFYPACIQLSVGGSQTGQPTSNEEITLPGGYSDTDPGILTPNVYNPGFTYTFPGPNVATLGSGGSGSGSSGGSSASTPAAPSPSAGSSSPSPPAGSGSSSGSGASVPPMPSYSAGSGSSSGSGASAPAAPSSSAGPPSPSSAGSSALSSPGNAGGDNPPSGSASSPPASSSVPSSPNAGGNPPSGSVSASSPSSTGGSSSTCKHKQSSPQARAVEHKRMHRRRYRTSH